MTLELPITVCQTIKTFGLLRFSFALATWCAAASSDTLHMIEHLKARHDDSSGPRQERAGCCGV